MNDVKEFFMEGLPDILAHKAAAIIPESRLKETMGKLYEIFRTTDMWSASGRQTACGAQSEILGWASRFLEKRQTARFTTW